MLRVFVKIWFVIGGISALVASLWIGHRWVATQAEADSLLLALKINAEKAKALADQQQELAFAIEELESFSKNQIVGTLSKLKSPKFVENLMGRSKTSPPSLDGVSDGRLAAAMSRLERNHERLMERVLAITNNVSHRAQLLDALPSVKPTDGWLSSTFGRRKSPHSGRMVRHNGIDLAAWVGSPILAAADGVVKKSGINGNYGKTIDIDHGNGIMTRYAHAKNLFAKRGEKVRRGQKIAEVGMSGRTTGAHLHYEIHVNGRPVDPVRFLSLTPIQPHKGDQRKLRAKLAAAGLLNSGRETKPKSETSSESRAMLAELAGYPLRFAEQNQMPNLADTGLQESRYTAESNLLSAGAWVGDPSLFLALLIVAGLGLSAFFFSRSGLSRGLVWLSYRPYAIIDAALTQEPGRLSRDEPVSFWPRELTDESDDEAPLDRCA